MRKSMSGVGTVTLSLLLAGCGGDGDSPSGPSDGASSFTIEIRDLAFQAPGGGDAITVSVGDTVRWINQDAVAHTVTSSDTPQGGASFDSGTLNQGQTFVFVPQTRGTWTYLCEFHPALMFGARVIVN